MKKQNPHLYKNFILLLLWTAVALDTWTYFSNGDVSLPLGRARTVSYSGEAALVILIVVWVAMLVVTWAAYRKKS